VTDEVKVRQIVLNLLSNAVKFTSTGSLRVALRLHEDAVRVSVSDTGVGIPSTEHEKIFDAFWQAEVGRGGAGLGLALTRQLARRLGGDVEVDSEPGRGSTFTVTLPHDES